MYLDFLILSKYPKIKVYTLAYALGDRLVDFLGETKIKMLIEADILMSASIKSHPLFVDETYKLHPAAKVLEGFLLKIIKGKKLQANSEDTIGKVFGKNDNVVRNKIKDKRLIAKTKSVWDFCRNDVMHYKDKGTIGYFDLKKNYDEIIEIMVLLYKDFYGKTDPSDEIRKTALKLWKAYRPRKVKHGK